jgi:hypothetical protein
MWEINPVKTPVTSEPPTQRWWQRFGNGRGVNTGVISQVGLFGQCPSGGRPEPEPMFPTQPYMASLGVAGGSDRIARVLTVGRAGYPLLQRNGHRFRRIGGGPSVSGAAWLSLTTNPF